MMSAWDRGQRPRPSGFNTQNYCNRQWRKIYIRIIAYTSVELLSTNISTSRLFTD